jgi:hypothetical protein
VDTLKKLFLEGRAHEVSGECHFTSP